MTKLLPILLVLLGAQAQAGERISLLRLDPHLYGGPRGPEPREQLVAQTVQSWRKMEGNTPRWELSFHLEGEARGRRDFSLDVDRAWMSTISESGYGLAIGRVHPWDLSRNPHATRPWGQAAQLFPQNRGLLLGYGFSPAEVTPTPVLLGWIGAHFWSDFRDDRPFAFGLSATPFFLPGSGPETTLSLDAPATVGRFGRRPPGTVEVNGSQLPLRYELDRSRLWSDVLFQPQVMAQLKWRMTPRWETWLATMRAPAPDPVYDTSDYLRVRNDDVEAVAVVRPRFPQRWTSTLAQRLRLTDGPWAISLVGGIFARDDRRWGYELGLDTFYLGVAYSDDSPNDGPRYGEKMLHVDARLPAFGVVWFAGLKTHTARRDLWLRSGARVPIGESMSLDGGFDAFAGDEGTYYGEWRTNDRLYMVFRWEIGA